MVPGLEKPRVTEILVRIDCNGCVQKIKKALHGINGIDALYFDLPQQKLTIIGWADPEKIIKAIKKTRKTATVYSHSEIQEPSPPGQSEPTPPKGPPPPDGGNLTPEGNPPSPPPQTQPEPRSDQTPPPPQTQPEPPRDQPPTPPQPSEPPKDQPPQPPPPQEGTPQEPSPPPISDNQPGQTKQRDMEEIHVIHNPPPDYPYGYGPDPGAIRVPGPIHSYSYGQGYSGNRVNQPQPSHENIHGYSYGQGYRGTYANQPQPGPEPVHHYNYGQGYSGTYASQPYPGPEPVHGYSYGQGYSGTYASQPHPSLGLRPRPVHDNENGQSCGSNWGSQPVPRFRHEHAQPVYVTHSYNQYRPSPYITQYEYVQSPPRIIPYNHGRDNYSYLYSCYNNGDYQSGQYSNSNGNITSVFSDENPNSCTVS